MNAPPPLRVGKAGAVTTITLDRPEVLNAINPAMHDALQAAFDAFAGDPSQRVCVLTGHGRAFCAGSDLKAGARASGYRYPSGGYGGLVERFDLDKPVIASVNGLALGGGFELVLACDIVIAADTASFGLPEPRVGAIAVGGGVDRLVRQMPLRMAMGYLLTGHRISAQEALAHGLVNAVVPAADLGSQTQAWCDAILACSPVAVETTKALARRSLAQADVAQSLRGLRDTPEFSRWWSSDDPAEGVNAFAEKRPPRWRTPN